MFSFVNLFFAAVFNDFVSVFVHKLYIKYIKLYNAKLNGVFILFDVYSVQPVLSGHLAIPTG